jgi:hypothetical protein
MRGASGRISHVTTAPHMELMPFRYLAMGYRDVPVEATKEEPDPIGPDGVEPTGSGADSSTLMR